MFACHVCGLPMEVQGRFEVNDEPWVSTLCVDAHVIMLRAAELPAGTQLPDGAPQ